VAELFRVKNHSIIWIAQFKIIIILVYQNNLVKNRLYIYTIPQRGLPPLYSFQKKKEKQAVSVYVAILSLHFSLSTMLSLVQIHYLVFSHYLDL